MQLNRHPSTAAIDALTSWADAANREDRGEALTDRQRQEIALRLNSPQRPGHVGAADPNHLPLFVAANEPPLL